MNIVLHTPEKTTLIVSTIKKTTFNLLSKGDPDALCVFKDTVSGDKELVFKISFSPAQYGTVSKFGVVFNSIDKDDHLVAILPTPTGTEAEIKQKVAEMVLPAQMNLLSLETSVAASAAQLVAAQTALKNTIVIS